MVILGVNAFHADAAACIVINGEVIVAVEEERLCRVKHWAGFPLKSIIYCLESCDLKISDVDHIAINRNPRKNIFRKMQYSFMKGFSGKAIFDRLKNMQNVQSLSGRLAFELGVKKIPAKVHNVEHHYAHLSSSFYASPFKRAAILSIDGFGDFTSTMWGLGIDNSISVLGDVKFPHSLGIFYLAITQFLGFENYGDEYKVMGLAPYGELSEVENINRLLDAKDDGTFKLVLEYFTHHKDGVEMNWSDGAPFIGRVFSKKLIDLLGPSRLPNEKLSQHHKDIAASAQNVYETVLFKILERLHNETGLDRVAIAGGCAMNSVANGKISSNTAFKEVYIPPAPGDAGGAIGAALAIWNKLHVAAKNFEIKHAYLGPEYSTQYMQALIDDNERKLFLENCVVKNATNDEELSKLVAKQIFDGKVVGWFQGRLEWGPRALGNRSILGDPRRADMKDILNLKIKRRESFRPFAPSIIDEARFEWFEIDAPVPFMESVFTIREDKRKFIPAVTHVNGSGRLQTVLREYNPKYYDLIKAFNRLSGVPMILNTSFNENEPVVCKPEEALECFLRTKMDVLVLGNLVIERQSD
jgi:carbamoyltransferase